MGESETFAFVGGFVLSTIPTFFAFTVFTLVLVLIGAMAFMPLAMLVRSEPDELRRLRRERAGLRDISQGPEKFGIVRRLILNLDLINVIVGHLASWLALFMALLQFVALMMRYLFAFGSIQMQESMWYMHGLLLLFGVGYTLIWNGYLRLDALYANALRRRRALVDLLGSIFFLLPISIATWWLSWIDILDSWAVRVGSTGGGALPFIYLFKSIILVFAVLLAIQGTALVLRSLLTLMGDDERDATAVRESPG